MFTIGFGTSPDRSRNRVPRPPQKSTTFTSELPFAREGRPVRAPVPHRAPPRKEGPIGPPHRVASGHRRPGSSATATPPPSHSGRPARPPSGKGHGGPTAARPSG